MSATRNTTWSRPRTRRAAAGRAARVASSGMAVPPLMRSRRRRGPVPRVPLAIGAPLVGGQDAVVIGVHPVEALLGVRFGALDIFLARDVAAALRGAVGRLLRRLGRCVW